MLLIDLAGLLACDSSQILPIPPTARQWCFLRALPSTFWRTGISLTATGIAPELHRLPFSSATWRNQLRSKCKGLDGLRFEVRCSRFQVEVRGWYQNFEPGTWNLEHRTSNIEHLHFPQSFPNFITLNGKILNTDHF